MSITETALSAQAKIFSIKALLTTSARWRESVAKKHGDDSRNLRAAALLQALASEPAEGLPETTVAKIAASSTLRKAAVEVARQVGFALFPENLAEFFEDLLAHAADEHRNPWRTGGAR